MFGTSKQKCPLIKHSKASADPHQYDHRSEITKITTPLISGQISRNSSTFQIAPTALRSAVCLGHGSGLPAFNAF